MSGVRSPLRLHLRPSYRLATLIFVLHAIAGACLYAVSEATAGTALAALAIALGAVTAWDRALLRSNRSPRAVELFGNEPSQVEFSGGLRAAVADGRRSVTRFWVTLPLRSPSRRTALVTADMLEPEAFRILRLWALWGRLPTVASGQLFC